MGKFYDWHSTFSRQTGTQGEICIVAGAKDIGKTFGLRLECIKAFITKGETFCEICRSDAEMKKVVNGYASKLQAEGFFTDYEFKTDRENLYARPAGSERKHDLVCEFVSLTAFQSNKKRTYHKPRRIIFDEFIIDSKDRYHRYLPDEVLIFANLLDTITRQQPDDDYRYNVYLIGNAVHMTCPYLYFLGIRKIPEFGYHWYRDKTVLFHYVEPWDADERRARTLVGRMLAGSEESKVVFDNEFQDSTGGLIKKKSQNARFAFAVKWARMDFGIWIDYKYGYVYVNERIPKDAKAVYALTKRDGTVNNDIAQKGSSLLNVIVNAFYNNGLRYESAHVREAFFEVLSFLGVK